MNKLFAVYLGGYAPNCNVEIHDMVFVVGETFESTFPALVQKWFLKIYDRFHYDGYQDLSIIDGHKITLTKNKPSSDLKLYYVHLGGYNASDLTEHHQNVFVIAQDKATAKSKARASWTTIETNHKDILCDVESCLQIDCVDGLFLEIHPTDEKPESTDLHLGYNLIPQDVIAKYKA